jgi:ABC-type polysaccharide/polyol phosphate export permease
MSALVEQYDSARQRAPMVREATELLRYRSLVRELVARNIKVRYKRSVLGVAWSMLGPLLTMGALSIVFTQLFHPVTPNYPLYLFPGLLLWTFFSQTTSTIIAEVIGGVELWKRIYTPRTAFAAATTATGLVHLGLALVPLVALMLVMQAPLTFSLAIVPFVAVCAALFALGMGLAVASVAGHFADAADIYQVILATWMYFTPVIYPIDIIPEAYRWIWRLNPMAYLVDAFRRPFYEQQAPSVPLLLTIFVIASATCAAGAWLFTRTADDLARRG